MSRSLRVRQPRTADIRRLHELFESALESGQRRRAQAILLYAAGLSAVEIARLLEVHANTIYADLHAFDIYGVTAVYRLGQGGAPQQITPAQLAEVWRLAELPPYELGFPYGRWSLSKLRSYLIKYKIVSNIRREHLRRVLKKGGFDYVALSVNCPARIPSAARFSAACAWFGGIGQSKASCCSLM